ncbi:MAG: hypothetical protein OEY06_09355 [Gammaproteobacteria bacterium]|nr:hypothetical protein [Gammaproteobacteria bacterium]
MNKFFPFNYFFFVLIIGFLTACGGGGGGAPATPTYTIGGSVSGLTGSGLVLQNNAGDNLTISADGTFNFVTAITDGDSYAVSVLTQPGSPAQTCSISNAGGTLAGSNITNVNISCITNTYSVGINVSGLSGGNFTLQNNNGDDLLISADGSYVFSTAITDGNNYAVSFATQPASVPQQTCSITSANGSGTITSADVSGININCVSHYTVGVTVNGLAGSGLVLQNNNGDDLSITTGDGDYIFNTSLLDGSDYAVSILRQPTALSQNCSVTSGTGTVASADVSGIAIDCTTNSFTVGGTVTGLQSGNTLTLQNSAGDDLPISANGVFTFATPVTDGLPYDVTLLTTPSDQSCTSTHGASTLKGANITHVNVFCGLQPGGLSAAVGALPADIYNHSQVTLNDGTILVAGGISSDVVSPAAYLYDPVAKTWTPTGSLNTQRAFHSATLLSDGKVLVAGGSTTQFVSSQTLTAEIYDPAASTWSTTGDLTIKRSSHTATLLQDGSVLITGGWTGGTAPVTSAEIYNPVAGTWAATGSMSGARTGHTMNTLIDGKVLVAGGFNVVATNNVYLQHAETYNPAMGTWSNAAGMSIARSYHAATMISGGKMLVTGGRSSMANADILASSEIYDPAADTWTSSGDMRHTRNFHTATALTDGRILIAGGQGTDGKSVATLELYKPGTNTWSWSGSLVEARDHHTATRLSTGEVIISGGLADNTTLLAKTSTERYDPALIGWSSAANLPNTRLWHATNSLTGGRAIVSGGLSVGITSLLYDLVSDTWTDGPVLNANRNRHVSVTLPDGRVLAIGGRNSSADIYDPVLNIWTAVSSSSMYLDLHDAVLLADGRVLVIAGYDGGSTYFTEAQIYDPATDSWSPAGNINVGRVGRSVSLLPSGKVIVAGGGNSDIVEIYDPQTNSWTLTSTLPAVMSGAKTTLLPDGKLLLSGGLDNTTTPLNTAYLYDPATDIWSSAASMVTARYSHASTLLPDGRVLISGGNGGGAAVMADDEIYDPASNTWSAITQLATPRYEHTANLLSDGSLLIVGGRDGGTYMDTAERLR